MEKSRTILRNRPKYLHIFPPKTSARGLRTCSKMSLALDAKTGIPLQQHQSFPLVPEWPPKCELSVFLALSLAGGPCYLDMFGAKCQLAV